MSNEQRKILLKTDTKRITLELGHEGKFVAKATGFDDERAVVYPLEKIEITVSEGRWIITKVPAPAAPPVGWFGDV
jgi:hypothetical protein